MQTMVCQFFPNPLPWLSALVGGVGLGVKGALSRSNAVGGLGDKKKCRVGERKNLPGLEASGKNALAQMSEFSRCTVSRVALTCSCATRILTRSPSNGTGEERRPRGN